MPWLGPKDRGQEALVLARFQNKKTWRTSNSVYAVREIALWLYSHGNREHQEKWI